MTIAKATVTGTVYRTPEKRFTQNDIAIYGMTLNVDGAEETLIRVISKRKALSEVLDRVKKGDKLLIDGRLQVAVIKSPEGAERKCFEIDANEIELLSGSNSQVNSDFGEVELEPQTEEVLPTFTGEPEMTETALMPEDEVPF